MQYKRPVVVTGIPRSGTSFVTEILHCDLRIQMANTIGAPVPGTTFLDYEDLEINQILMRNWKIYPDYDQVKRDFERYFKKRQSQLRYADRWGFKSPFALLFPHQIPKEAIIIKTKRDMLKIRSSLHRHQMRISEFELLSRLINDTNETYNLVTAHIVVDFDKQPFDRLAIGEYLMSAIKRIDNC